MVLIVQSQLLPNPYAQLSSGALEGIADIIHGGRGWKLTLSTDANSVIELVRRDIQAINANFIIRPVDVNGVIEFEASPPTQTVPTQDLEGVAALQQPQAIVTPTLGVPQQAPIIVDAVEEEEDLGEHGIYGYNETTELIPPLVEARSGSPIKEVVARFLSSGEVSAASELSNLVVKINKMLFEIAELQRKADVYRKKLDDSPILKKIEESIEKAKGIPLVEDIFFSQDLKKLIIYTKELVTAERYQNTSRNNPEEQHRKVIGRMAFYINLQYLLQGKSENGADGIIIKNRDRVFICKDEDGDSHTVFHAGHVNNVGAVCFGNAGNDFMKTIQMYDIEQMCELLIRFIQHPDFNDSWGAHLYAWPNYQEVASVPS